MNTFYSVMKGI